MTIKVCRSAARLSVAGLGILLTVGLFCQSARAQSTITTLFSTGSGSAEGNADLHYSLIAAPTGVTLGSTYVTTSDGFPIGPWLANETALSGVKWIEPTSGTTDTHPVGDYTYRTTFSLAGFNPAGARVSLKFAADNTVTSILLNGTSVGTLPSTSYSSESSQVDILTGFVSGSNTLDFVVNNAPPANTGNPTGLRVRIVSAMVIPEPSSACLVLAVLPITAAGVRRARRRARTADAR